MNSTDTNTPRGLTLDVLRPAHGADSTNRGLSSRVERVTVVGIYHDHDALHVDPMPADMRVFSPTAAAPAAVLHVRTLESGTHVTIVPATIDAGSSRVDPEPAWVMAGGNYAGFSDSRISALLRDLTGHPFYGALPIHDRIER